MTQEEKAKRYDEALEKAKEIINYYKECNRDEASIEDLEIIFSELKESEDDRIRKWLMELVEEIRKANPTNADHNGMCSEAIAWLEKQDNERKITHEEICKFYGISDIGEFSDGYHTFNGLYRQRMILFAVLVKTYKDRAWKSWKHEDGLDCFGGGWFIVGIDTPAGTYTYHYEAKDWDRFDCKILDKAKHWDGHDESDVERLFSLLEKQGEQKHIEMKSAEESLGITSEEYNKIVDECIYGEQKPADNIIPIFKTGNVIKNKKNGDTVKIEEIDEKRQRYCYKGWDGAATIHSDFSISEQDDWELVEQNPADKVEPKFKVGEWVVTSYGKVNQVIAVDEDGDGFTLDDDTYFSGSWKDNYHLWTIQDAKDGDVLVNGSNIFIFHFINGTRLMGYCHVNNDDGRFYDDIGKNECFCLIDAVVNPAFKEQREQLEKAMADARYTFDFEKKELKKIEQNPAWSEEDEKTINELCNVIAANAKNGYLGGYYAPNLVEKIKSLRSRNTWKPSDEQMKALKEACDEHWEPDGLDPLYTLYQDLKKLKEE